MKHKFSQHIFEKCYNTVHKNPSSGSRVVPCWRTNIAKLKVAFHNFADLVLYQVLSSSKQLGIIAKTKKKIEIIFTYWMYVPCIVYNLLFTPTNVQYINSNVYFVKYSDMFRRIYIIFRQSFLIQSPPKKCIHTLTEENSKLYNRLL